MAMIISIWTSLIWPGSQRTQVATKGWPFQHLVPYTQLQNLLMSLKLLEGLACHQIHLWQMLHWWGGAIAPAFIIDNIVQRCLVSNPLTDSSHTLATQSLWSRNWSQVSMSSISSDSHIRNLQLQVDIISVSFNIVGVSPLFRQCFLWWSTLEWLGLLVWIWANMNQNHVTALWQITPHFHKNKYHRQTRHPALTECAAPLGDGQQKYRPH